MKATATIISDGRESISIDGELFIKSAAAGEWSHVAKITYSHGSVKLLKARSLDSLQKSASAHQARAIKHGCSVALDSVAKIERAGV